MWGNGQPPRWPGTAPIGQHPTEMGTPAWSFDQNHYAQIPHNQVDWASLAQQWIQMKGTDARQLQDQCQESIPPTPTHHQHQLPNIQSHQPHHQDVIGEAPMDLDETVSAPLYTRSSSITAGSSLASSPSTQFNSSQQQPWTQNSFFPDANLRRGSAAEPEASHYDNNTWQSAMDMGSFSDRRYSTDYATRKHSYQEEETYEEDFAEAARRRALPSWIREGLEKVEREKRKAEERERLASEREEERRLRRKRDHEQTDVSMWADAEDVAPPSFPAQPFIASGSDFVEGEELSIKLKGSFRQSQPRQQSLEDILASLTKDEQMEQVMLSVRRQLTKILLEVTNEEMRLVAEEAIERGKAKQKVTSSRGQSLVALTSLTGGPLGLGDYGSASDSEDQDSNNEDELPQNDEEDSEDELMAEIERKKRNFEMRLLAAHENQDGEDDSGRKHITRSRSKSGETLPGTNGKIVPTPSLPVPVAPIMGAIETRQGEEVKVDEKKSTWRRPSRSRSLEKHQRQRSSSNSSSRRQSSSLTKDKLKRERSRSRDRRRRQSRSHSQKRDRHRRSRSGTPSNRIKSNRRSRSSSKSRTERKSRSSSKSRKGRRKSRSSSKSRKGRQKSRSSSKSRKGRRKSRSSSKSKKDRRRSRSSSKSRNERRKNRSTSKSRKRSRRSRSSSKTKQGKKSHQRRHQSRSSSRRRSRSHSITEKKRTTVAGKSRRHRSDSSSSTRSSRSPNSSRRSSNAPRH